MADQAPVFQIAGYKNSGKTTLLSEIIAYGFQRNDRVAAIKHHGHHEPLKVMHQETDSYRLHESGAFLTGVDSPGRFQLELSHNNPFSLKELVQLYQHLSPDLIIVEGFKYEDYPKAVIIKKEEDIDLLQLSNVQMVFTWEEQLTDHLHLPVYPLNTWRKKLPEIYDVVKGRHKNE